MKTLVIVTHPNIEQSVINKRWIAELAKSPKNIMCMSYTKHTPMVK